VAGDTFLWVNAAHCEGTTPVGAASASRTVLYTHAANAGAQLHDALGVGVFKFCYRPVGGLFTRIGGYDLSVIERPTFTPMAVIAGKPTFLTFTGALPGPTRARARGRGLRFRGQQVALLPPWGVTNCPPRCPLPPPPWPLQAISWL
jgi:hypothetical protein